jgi:hypothetical protein
MIKITHKGDFRKTIKFLNKVKLLSIRNILEKYGRQGVQALAAATPVDTGKTANSWTYEIEMSSTGYTITWLNTNVNKHVNIALILQYGHGTRNGGYVRGRDYINPAIQPIFDRISAEAWREVESA